MRLRVISGALIAIVAFPLLAASQSAPSPSSASPGELRQELKRNRYVVLPRPPIETVTRDAQQAADEIASPQRQDEAVREARRRPLNRPDLDHDVVQGIQAQQIHRALRR